MIGKRARVGLTLAIILNLVFTALVFVPAAMAATVAITPASPGNWTIQDDACAGSNTGIYDYIAGPGTPPLGIGSARFRIGANGDSYGGWRSSDLDGVQLNALQALSYSTYVSANVDSQAPYMTLAIDADGEGEFTPDDPTSKDTTLYFEPVYQDSANLVPDQGDVVLDTWQTWDAFTGGWWSTNSATAGGPPLITLAGFLAENPDATIISPGTPAGGLTVRAGCGAPAWNNFVGNMDNVVVKASGNETTFNFDSIPQCTTTCYVNVTTGDDYTKGGTSPADAKKTIQAAVDTVDSGGTVIVAAGTYPEHVVISKPLTLQGPNAGVNPNLSTRNAEARVVPPTNNFDGSSESSTVIVLDADDITINGLLIDGDNTAVGGGVAMNGADVNVYYGISNSFTDGTYEIEAFANDTTIENTILRNLGEGIDLYADGNTNSTGTLITNNRLDNMSSADDGGKGILLGANFYASVTNNVITRAFIGLQSYNFFDPGEAIEFSNNRISSYAYGIVHNLHYLDASTITTEGNQLTTADYASWSAPGAVTNANHNIGILVWTVQNSAEIVVSSNNVDGAATGISAWNVPTTNTVTISGGTLTNNQYGVKLYSCDDRFAAGAASTLNVRGVTISNSSIAGLAVLDNPQAKTVTDSNGTACTTSGTNAQLLDAREVSEDGPSQTGILADGPKASLTVTRSAVVSNTTGIAISNGAQAAPGGLHFNVIVGNSTGLNATGATGSVNAENNWWGCNAGPGSAGCDTIAASADANPWLTLRLTRVPGGATAPGGTVFAVTADLIINSDGQDTSGTDTILDGTPVTYAVTSGGGSITPTTTGTVNGVTTATFTASNACGAATIAAQSDDQVVSSSVTIAAPCAVQVTLSLTTSGTGSVEVTPPGGSFTNTSQIYDINTVVTLEPTAGNGQTFAGWMVDGVFSGWAPTLTITMNDDREVEAIFSATRTFSDVGLLRGDYNDIVELASRGYILGYGDGTYGPDKGVLRAEMAALIARATPKSVADNAPNLLTPPDCAVANTWACEVWNDVPLSDLAGLDPNLQRNIRALAHYRVAVGYSGAACNAGGKAFPCYGPTDPVTFAQTVSFITRAMIVKGYWVAQPNAPQPYAGIPSAHDQDVRTFAFYTGGVPALPNGDDWNDNATRGWFAEALWAALNSYWGTDGNLPDGRPAGGNQP